MFWFTGFPETAICTVTHTLSLPGIVDSLADSGENKPPTCAYYRLQTKEKALRALRPCLLNGFEWLLPYYINGLR